MSVVMESSWQRPSLWRVVIFASVLGLLANVLLWRVAYGDDTFARIIAVASGVGAVALLAGWFKFRRMLDDALLLTFAVWVANVIEFTTTDDVGWEPKLRQGGMYAAFGLLALGAYVARRTTPVE